MDLVRQNRDIEWIIKSIARRRVLSIAVVFLLSLGGCLAVSLFQGIPEPYLHDEYSYLLAADTFAHGRITNPSHPLWKHFEDYYLLMKPTYMSKYPPAQGVFLALGKIVFGHPIWGVWITDGLMSAAICWMLYAWVPARWALIGGLLTVIQFGIPKYFSQTYLGGPVAALGGALVFGAAPRIFQYQRIRDVLWLGLGLAILWNSRPLEGVLLGIPIGIMVLPWKIQWDKIEPRKFMMKIILPFLLCLMAIAAFMGYYNKQITGNPFLLPSKEYLNQYARVPMFIWQPLKRPLKYNHKDMGQYIKVWEIHNFMVKRRWKGFLFMLSSSPIWLFYLGGALSFCSLFVLASIKLSWQKIWPFIFTSLILLAYAGIIFCVPLIQYYAPFICLLVLLIVVGLRIFSTIQLHKSRWGLIGLVLLMSVQLIVNLFMPLVFQKIPLYAKVEQATDIDLRGNNYTKEQLKDILLKKGGEYLVIVQYPKKFDSPTDFIYNDADIDHSPIVWARDMGQQQNKELLDYFKDRRPIFIQI